MKRYDNIPCKTELLSVIKKYDYISFDVFDTLIFRTVTKPSDIFLIVEKLFEKKYDKKLITFHIKRTYAEAYARNKEKKEINLDDIYRELDYDVNTKRKLKVLELNCELDNCMANVPMVELLNCCRKLGKKIIITTDMYLPRVFFERVLGKIGVNYDKLFISGEFGVTKRNGGLYEVVLNTLGIDSNQIIHIGDDPHNDIDMPSKYGIKSIERLYNDVEIESYLDIKHHSSNIKLNHLNSIFKQTFHNYYHSPSEFRIGYTVYGPFIYSFCKWVHHKKSELALDKLLFLARDGYLLKKVYEAMYPEDQHIIDYICLNKNLMRLPAMAGKDKKGRFIKSLPPRKELLWDELFVHFGIVNVSEVKNQMKRIYETIDFTSPLFVDDIVNGLYDDYFNYLIKIQNSTIEEQKILLYNYLIQIGIIGNRVGLVNNSMKGSSQLLLCQYAVENDLNLDLYGIQFTASDECRSKLGNRVVCFYPDADYNRAKELFNYHCLEFEHLLFEHVGTARKFGLKEDGSVIVLKDSCGNEKENFQTKGKIQKFAVQFALDYKSHIDLEISELSKNVIENFFFMPKEKDALLIGSFWDKDVEGTRHLCNFDYTDVSMKLLWKHRPLEMGWMSGNFSIHHMPMFFLNLYKKRVVINYYLKDIKKLRDDIIISIRQSVNNIYHSLMKYLIETFCLIRYKYMFFVFRVKYRIFSNEY